MRRVWSENEIIVLVAIFSCSKFSMGDDNQPLCADIAFAFNRTPATIDRQWRNIKDILDEKNVKKIGQLLVFWTNQMLQKPKKIRATAKLLCDNYHWNLTHYLEGRNEG